MMESLYPSFTVLLVDDEEAWLRSMSVTLAISGGINNVKRVSDPRRVMDILARENVGLVLLDLNMPHISGTDLLSRITEEYPQIPVIILSGMNQVETAVECMRRGAFDYFIKTVEEERLIQGVQLALRMIELQQENRAMRCRVLHDTLDHPEVFADFVTASQAMRSIFKYIEAVATSTQPVLIIGESGVGKELAARCIHRLSGRRGKQVSLNVAGLDDVVVSDTLFGHTRGAYTGAEAERSGLIAQAADGTLFLDEIGDLSTASQVKLLRLLQEGEYFPLGSDLPKRMSARVVAATNQDLHAKQEAGLFRKDLFYRLNAHHVRIPPLRERPEDIAPLFDHFLEQAARSQGKPVPTVPKELGVLLANYSFPGNVRELKSMVHDAVSLHRSHMLSMDSFKRAMGEHTVRPAIRGDAPKRRVFADGEPLPGLHEVTDLLVEEAMRRAQGNQSIAARLLGVSQPALSKRLKHARENHQSGNP